MRIETKKKGMKTTTVMFTLFLAAFGLCMTASALPHGEPVGLRVYTHNIYIRSNGIVYVGEL